MPDNKDNENPLKNMRKNYQENSSSTEDNNTSEESYEELGKRVKGLTYVKGRNLLQINVVFSESPRDKKIVAKLERLIEEHGTITNAVKYLILNS